MRLLWTCNLKSPLPPNISSYSRPNVLSQSMCSQTKQLFFFSYRIKDSSSFLLIVSQSLGYTEIVKLMNEFLWLLGFPSKRESLFLLLH